MKQEAICPACGARNEPDSNFCDQCSEALKPLFTDSSSEVEELAGNTKESLPWGLVTALIVLFLTLLLGAGTIAWHHSPRFRMLLKYRTSPEAMQWIYAANYLDAETILGQPIPQEYNFVDLKNFEGIHELAFLDSDSGESITVLLADSQPDMAVNEINAAWNAYAKRVLDQKKVTSSKARVTGNLAMPDIAVGSKKTLRLKKGDTPAQLIRVPLFKGGMADGMQVALKQDGKVYWIVAYEAQFRRPFSETAFVSFLNGWQSAKYWWSPKFSAEQKSWAYLKRGEWLEGAPVRLPEAMADFQKALELNPNNSEAQTRLQSLSRSVKLTDVRLQSSPISPNIPPSSNQAVQTYSQQKDFWHKSAIVALVEIKRVTYDRLKYSPYNWCWGKSDMRVIRYLKNEGSNERPSFLAEDSVCNSDVTRQGNYLAVDWYDPPTVMKTVGGVTIEDEGVRLNQRHEIYFFPVNEQNQVAWRTERSQERHWVPFAEVEDQLKERP